MSHHEKFVCPNCGFHATLNYCAECGQETHLHKDTFLGLLTHFIGHYFHYDSKFRKTVGALLFRPGKLTVAYWLKQRRRYILPVPLYISISAIFFLLFFFFVASKSVISKAAHEQAIAARSPAQKIKDSISNAKVQLQLESMHLPFITKDAAARRREEISKAKEKNIFEDQDKLTAFWEQLAHFLPKVFFLMIPFTALILKLLFRKRKDITFTDHAIFSLHFHSMIFVLMIISLLPTPEHDVNIFEKIASFLYNLIPLAMVTYLAIAIRNVYKTGWVKPIFYSIIISISYIIVFLIVAVWDVVYVTKHLA